MKKRMFTLLAVVSVIAVNPAFTFAVVPDRVVGVDSSMPKRTGGFLEPSMDIPARQFLMAEQSRKSKRTGSPAF
jgi:hypothetical protein